jgi:formylglycine-generating enzyme
MKGIFRLVLISSVLLGTISCSNKSKTTGWKYNDAKWGGFEKHDYQGQETGPNLVFIQGGTFTMGQVEYDAYRDGNALPRRITVKSFYMDETEVSNIDYREYTWWLSRVFLDYPSVFNHSLPDSNCWRRKLGFNEPMVRYYFRFPAYDDYPVVGVNWIQATNYASWRTDRVNEMIMIRDGFLKPNPEQINEDNFNTEAYLAGQYEGVVKKKLKSYSLESKTRNVKMEDGILLPEYRLPTEAEWEYAARAEVGDALFENVHTRRIYPWKGLSLRQEEGRYRGKFRANIRRDRGDMMGTASEPNDAGSYTVPVRAYWPNDYGLYHMAGNVSEWVMDVYRPLSLEDLEDMNPLRGNVFQRLERDQDNYLVEKDTLGRLVYTDETIDDNINRRNYQKADNIGFLDEEKFEDGLQLYDYGVSSLVNNKARVYKGGSWDDRSYWQAPGTRRFLDQEQALSTLGFRCAMFHVGGSKNMKKNF